jgi:hypothetical protein
VDGERIRVRSDGNLRRRRLAVAFRGFLAVPHHVVLALWTTLVVIVLPVTWLAALFAGRVPKPLHRFLAAYLRYVGEVIAWLDLLAGRYPRPRRSGEYPFAIEIPGAQRQRRLVTLLRLPLAVPASVLSSAFGVILATIAFASWFVALVLGRTTAGLQELGTFCLRYQLETLAYVLLLTSSYPKLEPVPTPTQLPIPGLE